MPDIMIVDAGSLMAPARTAFLMIDGELEQVDVVGFTRDGIDVSFPESISSLEDSSTIMAEVRDKLVDEYMRMARLLI